MLTLKGKIIVALLVVGGLLWFFTRPATTPPVAPKVPVPTEASAPVPAATPERDSSVSKPEGLTARVRNNGVRVYFDNLEFDDWSHCTVDMNFQSSLGYSYKYLDVAAHASTAINLNEFAKADGERFDPTSQKLQSLYVECDTPAGKRTWAGQFGQ